MVLLEVKVEGTRAKDTIVIKVTRTMLPEVLLEAEVGVSVGPEVEGLPISPFRTLSPSPKTNEDVGQSTTPILLK